MAHEGLLDTVDRATGCYAAAALWQATPPDKFIVVAGSTGSIAATRGLIAVIARLPDGHVVCGLDRNGDQYCNL